MDELQAMFPIYFPRQKEKGQREEEYNSFISQNENNLNQDINILFNGLANTMAKVKALEDWAKQF